MKALTYLLPWALALSVGCSTPAVSGDAAPEAGSPPADTGSPEPAPPSAPIKIASFNIQVFGPSKAARPEVMATLVRVIRSYDLVAVQEIVDLSESAPNRLLDAVNDGEGPQYAMALSPRTGQQPDDQDFQEQYAFLFNTETVTQLGPGFLFDDRAADLFQREPYVVRFTAGDELTLVLINVHTRPAQALAEIGALERVFAWARKLHAEEDDFIALGDFNAGCSYASAEALDALAISGPGYKWIVPHDADTNLAASRCAYDRIVITEGALAEWTGKWGVEQAFDDNEVSDHWPVWAEFRTSSAEQPGDGSPRDGSDSPAP